MGFEIISGYSLILKMGGLGLLSLIADLVFKAAGKEEIAHLINLFIIGYAGWELFGLFSDLFGNLSKFRYL